MSGVGRPIRVMLERGLAKNGERIGESVLDIGLGVEPALAYGRFAAPGGPKPVQPYKVAMALASHFAGFTPFHANYFTRHG